MTPPLTLILGMWCLTIRMSTNVTIPIFGLVMNLIRILGIWDVYIWFIFKNLIRAIFFPRYPLICKQKIYKHFPTDMYN